MFGIIEWVFSWFDYYFNFIININYFRFKIIGYENRVSD